MHRSVLIVEDDKDIRDSLSSALSLIGINVVLATHGLEALEKLKTMEPPCLILLDLMMPVMDGWQFRSHQERDSRISNVPVVVITADGNARTKAQKMGAYSGLAKPIDLTSLFSVVTKWCG